LRGLLISGAMSSTAFICYLMCGFFCERKEVSILPSWLLVFAFGLAIANLAMSVDIQNSLSDSSDTLHWPALDCAVHRVAAAIPVWLPRSE
jgi:hypothetical protein